MILRQLRGFCRITGHCCIWILGYGELAQPLYKLIAETHHQMINTKIRLIILFAAKNGEALYSQQKQNWELTVAQTMNSLLPNSDLN